MKITTADLEALCQRIAEKHQTPRDARFGRALALSLDWAISEGEGLEGVEFCLDMLLQPKVYHEM